MLVPEHRLNETGHAIEAELSLRLSKLQEKLDAGGLEQDTPGMVQAGCSSDIR